MATPKTQAEALKRMEQVEAEVKEIRGFLDKQTPKNIIEAIKTFHDALEIYQQKYSISKAVQAILDYDGNDAEMIAIQGFTQMNIIRTVLNEGWIPDWKNSSQYKYYPWFNMTSGVGLSYCGYVDTDAHTGVGSRLCFKTSELAKYAGTQFIKIYEKFYLL